MIDNEKQRFIEYLIGIATYYEKILSTTTQALYWHGLKRFELREVERALFNHTQKPENGQFMPKVSDVVFMLEGTGNDNALVAWSIVDSSVRKVGGWHDVAFDDWIIHKVIDDMGGWIALCSHNDKDWAFVAKEFQTRYAGYKIKRELMPYPSVLIGHSGAHNRGGGFDIKPPFLIGTPEKCKATIAGGLTKPLIKITEPQKINDLIANKT